MFRNPLIDAAVVLIVVLLIFGPKRLPMLGRSLGQGMREFKDSITGHSKDEEDELPELTESTALPQAAPTAIPQAAPTATPQPAAAPAPPPAPTPPAQPAATPAPERDAAPVPQRESAEVGPRDNPS
jgi:sec-independent protein translocase protein TatA